MHSRLMRNASLMLKKNFRAAFEWASASVEEISRLSQSRFLKLQCLTCAMWLVNVNFKICNLFLLSSHVMHAGCRKRNCNLIASNIAWCILIFFNGFSSISYDDLQQSKKIDGSSNLMDIAIIIFILSVAVWEFIIGNVLSAATMRMKKNERHQFEATEIKWTKAEDIFRSHFLKYKSSFWALWYR